MNNVIIALATPPLKGALALIRVSGDGAFEITDQIFSKRVSGTEKREIYYGTMSDNGQPIDLVLVMAFKGPNTFTGEDIVEISCHGSMLIANQIIEAYIKRGAVYATRGEFSSRAFYNGKMDLIEAESVNDLINATTAEAKNLNLMSLNGETSKLVQPLKEEIATVLASLEVNIDFPEYEDIEQLNAEVVVDRVNYIRKIISDLIKGGKEGKIVKEGLKVAIVGEPNVGKSSLLNALMNEEKAIVSDIPGTTRDIVEGDVSVKGIQLHLLDTAGIRDNADKIEALGIAKSEESIAKADLVIHVIDAEKGESPEDLRIKELAKDKILITVYNKSDLIKNTNKDKLYISAINKDIKPLLEKIYEELGLSDQAFTSPSLSSARQLGLLMEIDQHLAKAKEDAMNKVPMDLVSVNLLAAYNGARELLGEGATLDLTDEIFSRFCVGK